MTSTDDILAMFGGMGIEPSWSANPAAENDEDANEASYSRSKRHADALQARRWA